VSNCGIGNRELVSNCGIGNRELVSNCGIGNTELVSNCGIGNRELVSNCGIGNRELINKIVLSIARFAATVIALFDNSEDNCPINRQALLHLISIFCLL
jgi:hypothetical protein